MKNKQQEFKVLNMEEICEIALREQEITDKLFTHDEELGYFTINAGYSYHIELDRIPNKEALLAWVFHLSEKEWMTQYMIREFIDRVCGIKKWNAPMI